jgi:hypothetical protein
MAVTAGAAATPTLLLNIGDWTRVVDLPSSAHDLMIGTTLTLALGAGMLFFVGKIATWLDRRQAARIDSLKTELVELFREERTESDAQRTIQEMIGNRLPPGQRLRPVN